MYFLVDSLRHDLCDISYHLELSYLLLNIINIYLV
jgi:hypothetical protein